MGWYDWFNGIMQYLGGLSILCLFSWLVTSFPGLWRMEGKILFVGLDNAGKTTLLCLLSQDVIRSYPPTMHPQMDTVHIGKATFKAFDLGGHQNARSFWTHYVEVDAVVFMVDACDRDRFEEAKAELNIDNPRAVDEHTLRKELGLLNTTTGKPNKALPKNHPSYIRPVELFMCSVVKKAGLKEAFEWIERNVDI
ncbi:GTP-binding protein SAR1a, variant 2 [Balamuthia mandrillaris]